MRLLPGLLECAKCSGASCSLSLSGRLPPLLLQHVSTCCGTVLYTCCATALGTVPLQVPEHWPQKHHLGQWLSRQKSAWHSGDLPAARVAQLLALGLGLTQRRSAS